MRLLFHLWLVTILAQLAWAEDMAFTLGPGQETAVRLTGGSDLLIRARIDYLQPAGAAHLLMVTVDGLPLGPLTNKGSQFQYQSGRSFPYCKSDVWSVFYCPNFIDNDVSKSEYKVTTDPGNAYLYRWHLPGTSDQKVTVRVRHAGIHEGKTIESPLVVSLFSGNPQSVDVRHQELADLKISNAQVAGRTIRRRGNPKGEKSLSVIPPRPPAETADSVPVPSDEPSESIPPNSEAKEPPIELRISPGNTICIDAPTASQVSISARLTAHASGARVKVKFGKELLGEFELPADGQALAREWRVPGEPGELTTFEVIYEAQPGQPDLMLSMSGLSDGTDAQMRKFLQLIQQPSLETGPTRQTRAEDVWTIPDSSSEAPSP